VETCFRSEKGVRARNEDACGIWKFPGSGLTLLAVADGLGGHPAGDIASAVAVKELHRAIERCLIHSPAPGPDELRNTMASGFSSADREVFARGAGMPEWQGMGTTLVAALVSEEGRGILGNLGDSRAYSVGANGIARLTVDHSKVMEMAAKGIITLEQADRHPMKNIVTRIVGRPGDIPDFYPLGLENDTLILCSDGLTDGLRDGEIARIARITPFRNICHALVDKALLESRDNITVAVIKRNSP
jgi:serine/threonine protein phosphatase PrpC